MKYTAPPLVIGEFFTPCTELMFVLYMPVKMPNQKTPTIPRGLSGYSGLVDMALENEGDVTSKYVYLTVKSLWVEGGCIGGRPGWHADGFGTGDVNYVWADSQPTEYCNQPFSLSDDHKESMVQMDDQARAENITRYPDFSVVRINASHVHRCPLEVASGYRSFARVSISDDKYDLIGNAHNHDINYNWRMHPRRSTRNDTSARLDIHGKQGVGRR